MKIEASQNKAKDVETIRPQPKQQTSEELAFLLNQNYAQLMQAQQNIMAINKELERRHQISQQVAKQEAEVKPAEEKKD